VTAVKTGREIVWKVPNQRTYQPPTIMRLQFICKEMFPINVSQGSGFKDFVHELEPRHTVPSCATIPHRVVKLYDTTVENIRKINSGEKSLHI
jgi:hypothetical protein